MRPEGETREIMSGDRESEREREGGGGLGQVGFFFFKLNCLNRSVCALSPNRTQTIWFMKI